MMNLGIKQFKQVFKRIFRYLLKRYLGSYLIHFSSDEITYQLSHGTGKIEKVELNVEALNDLCEEYNLPVEFLQGSIEVVSIFIPWSKLLVDNTIIEVEGLKLVIQPKERPQDVSMFDSMWGSMASSLQLAEECIKNENDEEIMKESGNRSEGLEIIAKTIESVLRNTKVSLSDVNIQIVHVLPNKSTGISLDIKIAKTEYFDERYTTGSDNEEPSNESSAYAFKRFTFQGVSLYTSEFSPQEKTVLFEQLYAPENMESTMFVPGSPEMPPTHPSLPVKKPESNCNTEPILISKLNGQQELRLKLKQNEAVVGPKVDVEFNFGALNLFLTPQQVHRLFLLINGLIKPTTHFDASKKDQQPVGNKPMSSADYALLGQELLRQQERSDIAPRSLKNHQGWSSHSLDESDEDFHLMPLENKAAMDTPSSTSLLGDQLSSSISSDLRSEASSFSSNSRSRHRGSSVHAILTDPLSELTHFHGSFSSLLIIILHDDSVQETMTRCARSNSGSLQVKTETFFQDLLDLQQNGFNFRDFSSAREPLSKLCQANHLRLMASGIILDGNESSSSAERILKFNLSFNQLEVLECLFDVCPSSDKTKDPKYMKLISFPSTIDSKEACFKMKYSQVECTSQIRRHKPPANKLDIQFGTVHCDVDISLTDRIRTLLNFNGFMENAENKWDSSNWRESEIGLVSCQTSTKTEITVSSAEVTINLRFPIPDLRSVHDMERAPWWQQNIHKEILILVIKDLSVKTTLDDEQLVEKYEIQVRDIHSLFKIPTSEDPISFLRVSVDPDADEVSKDGGFDWPRLEIRRVTKVVSHDLENGFEEPDKFFSCSISYQLMSNLNSEPGPFESNRVLCEKSKKEKVKNSSLSSEGDEIIRPSEKNVMLNFIEQIIKESEYVLEFTLPTVNIVFPDKDFFELLYNRLTSDLALWSNTLMTSTNAYETGFKVHIPGLDMSYNNKGFNDLFPVFKPFTNDSNSESDEEETMYLSVHEYYQQQKQKQQKTNTTSSTKFSFSFNITKGNLLINSPIEMGDDETTLGHCGKLQLRVEDATIFFATYHKGDPNESYMCVLAEKSALYHDGMAAMETKHPVVEPLNSCIKSNMKKIIHASEPKMVLKSIVPYDNPVKEMLKFSVHIVKDPKQQIKTFKIAIEIAGATLRHYVMPSPQVWINQLIAFLKVRDFPVSGYVPPAVVTELHLNLSNCAVDYRPLKLPYRTALTVENFNMSCNVTATTPSFLFRIISEELRIFISNDTESKKIDLKENYVCVFDSGLIDISIRTSMDDKDNPKLEMSLSNNKVHFRTCADSFKALGELVNYLATNGDMEEDSCNQKETESTKSPASDMTFHPEAANLDQLMAEAMKECCLNPDGDKKATKTSSDFEYCNTDDEFCILEDAPGVGLIPRDGEPQIRMLTNKPIQIIENHFSVPPGKCDLLKAPEGFPNPIVVFTLKTQNLVWNFYGGNDFSKKTKSKKHGKDSKNDSSSKSKQVVTFSEQENMDSMALSFWKVTPVLKSSDCGMVQFSMEQVNIKESRATHCPDSFVGKGGLGRNHDVHMELQLTKVQFQKEVYPADSEHASRILLYVYDVVIKDKLANSKINKFLYQYSTKEQPKQSNSNMFDLKALFSRPDPKSSAEECSLRISLKPIRLNIDQDSLMFAIEFFRKGFDIPVSECSEGESENVLPPVPQLVSHSSSPECETFYRYFQFSPDVLIRIDYHGKRVQMEQGALKGLLLGLTELSASEIKLKRLCYRHGLLGHKKLVSYALNEWQQDIFKNQLPSLLGGLGPINSVVQLVQGVKDLFYLPVAHYRHDGQLVRGLQKGATSFSTSTVVAALDLTSRFFNTLQGTAQIGFDVVSPGPRLCGGQFRRSQEVYRKSSQPGTIAEGVAAAYNVMKEGLQDTARTIYRVASTEHEHKGVPGAVGGVLRQIPPSLFRPIILSSEATSYVLDGARHQLMPDAHQEDIHKWKTKSA